MADIVGSVFRLVCPSKKCVLGQLFTKLEGSCRVPFRGTTLRCSSDSVARFSRSRLSYSARPFLPEGRPRVNRFRIDLEHCPQRLTQSRLSATRAAVPLRYPTGGDQGIGDEHTLDHPSLLTLAWCSPSRKEALGSYCCPKLHHISGPPSRLALEKGGCLASTQY